jgi:hypothetical protein
MPEMQEREKEREEIEQEQEEEKKKFPVWIVPLVAGPVILLVLIVLLASTPPPGASTASVKEEGFNQVRLQEDANRLIGEGHKLYYEASNLQDQREKDKLLDKAGEACDKAIEKLDRIREYYEEHNIEHKAGAIWDWEQIAEEAYKLRTYITRDRGTTGY